MTVEPAPLLPPPSFDRSGTVWSPSRGCWALISCRALSAVGSLPGVLMSCDGCTVSDEWATGPPCSLSPHSLVAAGPASETASPPLGPGGTGLVCPPASVPEGGGGRGPFRGSADVTARWFPI